MTDGLDWCYTLLIFTLLSLLNHHPCNQLLTHRIFHILLLQELPLTNKGTVEWVVGVEEVPPVVLLLGVVVGVVEEEVGVVEGEVGVPFKD